MRQWWSVLTPPSLMLGPREAERSRLRRRGCCGGGRDVKRRRGFVPVGRGKGGGGSH